MRPLAMIGIGVVAIVAVAATAVGAAADHARTESFFACVIAGGDVALRGGWPACVVIETGDDRVYGSIERDGEPEPYEIWLETRTRVVTYLLRPEWTTEQTTGGIGGAAGDRLATPVA
jgi:hypothetical protein